MGLHQTDCGVIPAISQAGAVTLRQDQVRLPFPLHPEEQYFQVSGLCVLFCFHASTGCQILKVFEEDLLDRSRSVLLLISYRIPKTAKYEQVRPGKITFPYSAVLQLLVCSALSILLPQGLR